MSALAIREEWKNKIAAWRNSDLSIAAWCRENAEGYHRFLYWRKRLEAGECRQLGHFVELSLAASPISLECNGVQINISSGFDTGLLAEILVVLKGV